MIPINISIKIDGNFVKETGNLLRDAATAGKEMSEFVLHNYLPQLRMWAEGNLERCNDRLVVENKKRAAAGLRPIRARVAIPALAAIAQEDNDDMLLIWARLLANAQDGDREDVADRLLVDILSSMEPVDASVLKYAADVERDDPERPYIVKPIDEVSNSLGLERNRLLISLHNLSRLGCLSTISIDDSPVIRKNPFHRGESYIFNGDFGGSVLSGISEFEVSAFSRSYGAGPMIVKSETMMFRLTSLGTRLIDSCRTADERTTSSVYIDPSKPLSPGDPDI